MISTPDRQHAVALIEEAHRAGARLSRACAELGIDVRTHQRWTQGSRWSLLPDRLSLMILPSSSIQCLFRPNK